MAMATAICITNTRTHRSQTASAASEVTHAYECLSPGGRVKAADSAYACAMFQLSDYASAMFQPSDHVGDARHRL